MQHLKLNDEMQGEHEVAQLVQAKSSYSRKVMGSNPDEVAGIFD
jgi:hypothetical protein